MVDLAAVADLFEIRGDMILDLDLLTILRSRTKPLLFTCRSAREGGRWADTEAKRRSVLLEAVKRGFDYVDVEYRADFLDVIIEKSGNGLVLSYHDLEGTPEDLDELYARMCAKGADIVKIAVTPRSIADVGRLLELHPAGGRRGTASPSSPWRWGPWASSRGSRPGATGRPSPSPPRPPGAEAAPGQVPGGPDGGSLPRPRREPGDQGLRRPGLRRDAEPLAGPPQPGLRGAPHRRRLRSPAGRGPRALRGRPPDARPRPASA